MKKLFKNKFVIIILLAVFFSFGFSVNNVLAGNPAEEVASSGERQMGAFISSAGFSQSVQAEGIISVIILTLLSLLAVIFVILMIFSGYQWMTAGGNEEQVKKAQSRIKNAVIGLIIVVLAYAITAFVFRNLPGGSQTTTTPNVGGTP